MSYKQRYNFGEILYLKFQQYYNNHDRVYNIDHENISFYPILLFQKIVL